MADVFISYKQEERERVRAIAEGLRAMKIDVWFDADLEPGAAFAETIQRELHACAAQIVCWSSTATASQWVNGEAEIGRQRGVLVPVFLERCAPNPPFNMMHGEDLSAFGGEAGHEGWTKTLKVLAAKLGRPGLPALWPLLAEGSAAQWKAWADANPLDPFVDEAFDRYEALRLDTERNRLVEERAAARKAAEDAMVKREADAERATAEQARLARLREQDRADAEHARRVVAAAADSPQSGSSGRTTFWLALSGVTVVLALAFAAWSMLTPRGGAPVAAAPEADAPRAITSAALAAEDFRGAWAQSAEQCGSPTRISVATDATGEWLVFNSVISTSGPAGPMTAEAERRERIVSQDKTGVWTSGETGRNGYALAGNDLSIVDDKGGQKGRLIRCANSP